MFPAPTNYIPFDNLYKFMAIGGIVVSGVILYVDLQAQQYIDRLQAETNIENAVLTKEHAMLADIAKNAPERYKEWDAIERDLSYTRRVEANKQKTLELNGLKAARSTNTLYGYLFLSGLIISIIGFSLWYKRLQEYQDLMVQYELLRVQGEIKAQNKG